MNFIQVKALIFPIFLMLFWPSKIYENENNPPSLPPPEKVGTIEETLLELVSIIEGESEFYPYARSEKDARGYFQITPICLDDYNRVHKTSHTLDMMYLPALNIQVGLWYYLWLKNIFFPPRVHSTAITICAVSAFYAGQNSTLRSDGTLVIYWDYVRSKVSVEHQENFLRNHQILGKKKDKFGKLILILEKRKYGA